jgi:hypothetical protein
MENSQINIELKKDDKVICLYMDDITPIPAGIPGVVTDVKELYGSKIYEVKWKNGSKLSLVEGNWVGCSESEAMKQKRDFKREIRQTEDNGWEYKNGDTWQRIGSVKKDSIDENVLFVTTKKQILEIIKNK